ncbi:MAG TPA: hypothetical protein VKE41_12580 [Roseiflexaceae bacterium]|nr:hypothetical protein [Roseiflexaceae bacterium]
MPPIGSGERSSAACPPAEQWLDRSILAIRWSGSVLKLEATDDRS